MSTPKLCTMCSPRGINVKDMITCRKCKEKFCRHLVHYVDNPGVGVCYWCAIDSKEKQK